jgi:hypothetical protein
MLPLIIISSIKMGSFANWYGSICSGTWHIIVVERHRVIRRLIGLSSFPPLLGDFLFGVAAFA